MATQKIDNAVRLKRALVAIQELRTKLDVTESIQHEPIAVIGLGCRFPGAPNPDAFWQLLLNGEDAIREVPAERWNLDVLYDPNPDVPGKLYTRHGGFLEQIDHFDTAFFGISPRETMRLDPQQRLLLEISWEALEHAGINPETVAESETGVFLGISASDYLQQLSEQAQGEIDMYMLTGNDCSTASGRLSYLLGLQGPNLTVDTACSSSLVAVHLAVNSLHNRECDMALAGGVNVLLTPDVTVAFCRAGALAADGRCKAFDASADGYVRSEGCGIVVLKRLSDALASGDNILALIRGSAINQDGRTNGLTAPNGLAQQAVIRQAQQRAGVEPAQVSYVETHGTGTSLGDPIEVNALGVVFGERKTPLILGAAKTNIGHLEASAGVAGLIKAVLSIHHGEIPPNLHYNTPNPHIPWEDLAVVVPTKRMTWLQEERVAGVSSFGFSGTNAHIIVSQPDTTEIESLPSTRGAHLLTLAAKNETALADLVGAYRAHLANMPNPNLADICYTSNTSRSHFAHRIAIAATTVEALDKQLARLAQSKRASTSVRGCAAETPPKVAFLFTGQGAQYPGMGRQLYETQPHFRQTIDRCAEILAPNLTHSLHEILYPTDQAEPLIHRTQYAQPALFAVEYALAQLWRTWGIEPSIVLGHSTGEYVAACVAGVFTLEEGLMLIAERARLIASVSSGGATASVFADADVVADALRPFEDQVSIAGINSPKDTLVAGTATAVDALLAALKEAGVDSRRLDIPHAPHSPLMDPVLDEFEQIARRIAYQAPRCRLISNVTGEVLTAMDATYWRRHMRDMVRFSAGVRQLEAEACQIMVEIGPQPVLMWLGKQNWQGAKGVSWLPSIWPVRSDWEQMSQSAGELYTRGVELDWKAFHQDEPRRKVSLPTYPWQRQRYWIPKSAARTQPTSPPKLHPLLGTRIDSATFQQNEVQFETHLSVNSPAYLTDHRVYDYAILPTTAYLEMVLQAGAQVLPHRNPRMKREGTVPPPSKGKLEGGMIIEHVAIHQAIILPEESEDTKKLVQIVLKPNATGMRWQIYGKADEAWQLHAEGGLSTVKAASQEAIDLSGLQAQYAEEITVSDFYASCEAGNLFYGPTFRLLHQLWVQDERALGHVVLAESLRHDAATYQLHPALLDACLQVSGALFMGNEQTYLPIGMDRLTVMAQPAQEMWCEAQRLAVNEEIFTIDLQLYNSDGTSIARIDGLQVKATTQEAMAQRPLWHDWLYEVAWEAQPLSGEASTSPNINTPWLIFADDSGMGERVANELRTRGDSVVVIRMGTNYAKLDEQTIEIDSTAAEDYQHLLTRYPAPAGIVHAWSLNSQSTLEEATYTTSGTMLLLMQAMNTVRKLPPLWLVSQGVVMPSAGDAMPSTLAQSTIVGMAKTIRLEYRQLTCVHVDVDADAMIDDKAQMVLAELTTLPAEMVEELVAYRDGKRHVARLERMASHVVAETSIVRNDGTYLITGGLGALGLLTARWLVESGATRLVLMGRSQPKAAAQKMLDELAAKGATIMIAQADVADGAQVAEVLSTIDREYPLRGVIHAAGTLDDGALVNQSWSRFTPVFAPKVTGAWHLHTLTQDAPLDFFVLFSSIAALLGSAGQANHGAANAFLDALAHYRQAQGLPALSINWGAWSEVGQAAAHVAQMDGTGVGAISPTQGIEVMAHLLTQAQTQSRPQIGVVPIDWSRYGEKRAFYQKLQQASIPAKTEASSLVEQFVGKDAATRQQLLTTYIQEQVAHILQHDSVEQLDASHRFRELGMDSLTSMELRNRLQEALDCPLSAGIVFNFPTPDALAAHIVQDVLTAPEQPSGEAFEISQVEVSQAQIETAPPLTVATPMRTYALNVRGLSIHISEWGPADAPPIVCQHGIMDQGETWAGVAARLAAAGYRVIAPDLRGHGHSAHVGVGGSYHLRDFVGDMDGILAQLALKSVTLVGHSLGSMVAVLYLSVRQHSQPDRVRQLVLVEPIMPAVDDSSWVFAQQLDTHLRYLDVTSPMTDENAASSATTNGVYTNGIHRPMLENTIMMSIAAAAERLRQVIAIPQNVALRLAEQLTERHNDGFIWRWDARLDAHDGVLMAGLTQDAYVKMLGQITVPVHLVFGDNSGWLNADEKEAIQTALPHTQPAVLAGGHNLHIEAAPALADMLLRVVDEKSRAEQTT